MFFDDLTINITHHHLCHMLLVTGSISDTLEGDYTSTKYQEEAIGVRLLRGVVHALTCYGIALIWLAQSRFQNGCIWCLHYKIINIWEYQGPAVSHRLAPGHKGLVFSSSIHIWERSKGGRWEGEKKVDQILLFLMLLSWFSHSVVPDSVTLWIAACQALLSFTVSNSCTLSWWHHPIISIIPVTPFSSCPQSFPASGSFPMSWLFIWGGQSIGASALASVLPMNIQGWFPLGLTGFISLQSKGLLRVFSSTTVPKHPFFSSQPSLQSNSYSHTWLLEKPPLWLDRPLSANWCFCFSIHCLMYCILFHLHFTTEKM